MKLYRNLVNAVALTVQEIMVNGRYADKAIEYQFKKNPQWGSRDRRFFAEGVYDIVRNFRLYNTLSRAENNYWFITAAWLMDKGTELPDWPEFKHVNPRIMAAEKESASLHPSVLFSYPDWLWNKASGELGDAAWLEEVKSMNGPAPVFIRANALKTTAAELADALRKTNVETSPVKNCPDALMLNKRENVFRHELFKQGWFEVQDAGSQRIGSFLDPKPGDFVIDACAGAGGKTLHLAALMKNKGRIMSMDTDGWKLEELKTRARRAGAHNIETSVIENERAIDRLEGKADRLLLDVPCSGLGVIRRNPDSKWKLSEKSVLATQGIQKKILAEYPKMLKAGGTLVYSTCSILPSENRAQIDAFIDNHKEFTLVKEATLLTSETGFDGFYMAALQKK